MEYKFKCPKCGGTCVEEIMVNVTVTTRITSIHESLDFDYGDNLNEDGNIDHYQCATCGCALETNELLVNEPEELVEWIKEHTPVNLIVVVEGGVVQDVFSNSLISYEILDYDNEKCDMYPDAKDKNNRLRKEIEDMKQKE